MKACRVTAAVIPEGQNAMPGWPGQNQQSVLPTAQAMQLYLPVA